MRIIAIAESDDCGPFAIVDSDLLFLIKMEDLYIAGTRCAYRNTPITCEVSEEDAMKLINSGVHCVDMLEEDISIINEED